MIIDGVEIAADVYEAICKTSNWLATHAAKISGVIGIRIAPGLKIELAINKEAGEAKQLVEKAESLLKTAEQALATTIANCANDAEVERAKAVVEKAQGEFNAALDL